MRTGLVGALVFAAAFSPTTVLSPILEPLPLSLPLAPADICSVANLPAPIQDLLKNKFPLQRPRQVFDLSADDQQIWYTSHEKDCPGIAIGHFENNSQLAYAFLLVSNSKPNGGYKLVVFTKDTTGDAYSSKLLNQVEDNIDSTGLLISKVPPGKYSNFQKTRSIRMNLDGILLEWTKAGADLFYFSGGRYQKLNVSE
jgi:hypothetical protein